MEVTDAYVYVKVNAFNIIFPESDSFSLKNEFPLTDWFKKLKVEGKVYQKILWVLFAAFPIITVLASIDLGIWVIKGVLKKLGEVFTVALQSFGAKILAGAAIMILVILAAWLIWSGYWRELFAWLSFQYQSH